MEALVVLRVPFCCECSSLKALCSRFSQSTTLSDLSMFPKMKNSLRRVCSQHQARTAVRTAILPAQVHIVSLKYFPSWVQIDIFVQRKENI